MDPGFIPPELQQFVDRELASGHYQSAEEVLCAGLRLLQERRLHDLRCDVQAGLNQLDRGEGIELEDEDEPSLHAFFEDIKTRGRQRMKAE